MYLFPCPIPSPLALSRSKGCLSSSLWIQTRFHSILNPRMGVECCYLLRRRLQKAVEHCCLLLRYLPLRRLHHLAGAGVLERSKIRGR